MAFGAWKAGLCLFLATAAVAQEPSQADLAAANAARKAVEEGRYLDAEQTLRRAAFDARGVARPGYAYGQWVEVHGLLDGEPGPAIPGPDAPINAEQQAAIARLNAATPHDALATIVEQAKTHRLVILNEDHGSPRDRAFGWQVAKALRPLGYDVLGIETLNNVADDREAADLMARLSRDRYAHRVSTGYYVRDPVFADFVRQALGIGYRPVAYEATEFHRGGSVVEQISARDQAQADYLVRRALTRYPKSKVLLYVGFHHATEASSDIDGTPVRWLAARLKAMTGIDPLTIDQTVLNADGAGDRVLHAAVADRIGRKPAVMVAGDKPLVVGHYAGLVDLQVAHPRTRRIGGRPDWLLALGRTPTPIPTDLLPKTGKRLVQAFVTGETEAIPVDQVVVTAGSPLPLLMLPKAPVTFVVQDADAKSTG
jgi:hypothetical protein